MQTHMHINCAGKCKHTTTHDNVSAAHFAEVLLSSNRARPAAHHDNCDLTTNTNVHGNVNELMPDEAD